jgi:hypothetical protein
MLYVARPTFGRVLTVLVGVVCLVALIMSVLHEGWPGFLTAPWLLLAAGACWAVFWRPEVRVDDAGVHLVNVLRTVDLPWPSIQLVDTKWALALTTSYGTFTAWAAPTSTRRSGQEISPGDLEAMPSSTFGVGRSIRPGDSPTAPSGQAAMVIRRRWEELRDAGHLDAPQLEFDRPPVRWHWPTIGGAVFLVLLGILTVAI